MKWVQDSAYSVSIGDTDDLMFSTRVPVATVLSMHPWILSILWVNNCYTKTIPQHPVSLKSSWKSTSIKRKQTGNGKC